MFKALALLALSAIPAQARPGAYYCVAVPAQQGTRVPSLPGYGYGSTPAAASVAAIKDCKNRSAFGTGARCFVRSCSKN